MSRSRRHLRRESTHLLLTSCNVFGLDPNCKQQTSPPRAPGGVELLYSRQHAVFSKRCPVSRTRRHLRREPTHLLLISPHLLSYAPRLFPLSLPRPWTRLAHLKSRIMYRLSGKSASSCRYAFSAVYALNTTGMHFFSRFLATLKFQIRHHLRVTCPEKPASSWRCAVSGKILPSTVAVCHIFFLRFWSMPRDGRKASIMHRLQTTFRENLHRLGIRRFGENSALNSSGVHIFSCVFG